MFRKQTVKKILFVILILPVIFIIGAWLHDLFMIKIDTGLVDEYYDILSNVRYEGEGLALDLGCPEGTRPEIILERVKDVIGLPYGVIAGYHGADKPPAYIQNNNGLLTVYYSESLTKIKEIVNVTVHEMGHIYMWNVKKRFPSGFNEEKAVDVSGIYLGLGIQTLNGLTEGFFMTPGGSYHAEQKLFGYLSPEEFGYLLARYCRERNIDPENVFPFLNQTGKEYFGIGISYLERCGKIYATGPTVSGIYWCKECGAKTSVSLDGRLSSIKCSSCGKIKHLNTFSRHFRLFMNKINTAMRLMFIKTDLAIRRAWATIQNKALRGKTKNM